MVAENSTPRKRIWQYAFVIGMAACIVAAIVVFGMSSFTTILTVSGIIVGLFNAFLGSSSTANEGNWFLGRIKHTLDVSNFLRVATVIVWLTTFGLIGYGGLQAYREAQKVTVSGRVLTAGGDPVEKALVVLQTSQSKKEAITSADGTFAFVGLDLSREDSKQAKIRVEWKNRSMEEPLDLAIARQITLKFPAGDPPFRVSYITLEGTAIDLLLRGQIDKRWEERLSGQPFIVQNSVLNSLKDLMKKFSVRLEETEGQSFSVENDSGERADASVAAKTVGKSLFVGSSVSGIDRPASRDDLLSLSNPEQPWSLEVHEADPEDVLSSLSFWKFATSEDLSKFQSVGANFYKYITRTSMPSDFCVLSVHFGSCADFGVVRIEPRILKLRVAVLENVSPEPIRIGQFLAHEFKDESLRPRDEEEGFLKAQKAEQKSLFPLETLGPRERLVIPLDMPLVYSASDEALPPSSDVMNGVRRKLAANPVVTVPAESGEGFELQTARLLALMNKPPQNEMREKEYVFGPSMNIESVMVDGVSYPFRQFDISKLMISTGGGEIGSCPFVYTYSAESGEWEKEGHILYGRNSALKESTDEKRLRRFDGRLVIKEEDPEQSFIDFVYIKVILIDGREKLLFPLNSKLRFQDGNYLTMKQGDQIELQFDGPPNLFGRSYSIVSRGYYVPYARSSTKERTSRLGEK